MQKLFLPAALMVAMVLPVWGFEQQVDRSQAYYHFMLGLLKERSQNLSEAIEQYREALEHDPKASDIFVRLADLYVQTNRVPEAVQDAQSAIQKDPNNKEAHRMLGQIYLEKLYGNETNRQDLTNAIREFQAVHKIDPADDSAMLALGQLYLQANQPHAAAEILGKYLDNNPDSQQAIMSIASAFQQLNQPEKAITYLLKYSQLNPDNLYVAQQIADIYVKAGNHSAALEFQRRAYEADSDNPAMIRKYVDLLGRNQRYAEALSLVEARLLIEPDKLEWVVLQAKTYQKWGKQEQAESILKSRMAANPEDVDLALSLVQIYEEGSKFPDAVQELQRMLQTVSAKEGDERERKTNLAMIYSHLGYVNHQTKDYERSTEFYQKARSYVDPEDTGKFDFYIALNYRGLNRWNDAIELLNDVLKQDANDTDAWELLSFIYEEKGDIENSDKIIQHLIDTHPNSLQYPLMKAERLQKREKYPESIEYLKTMLIEFPEDDRSLFLMGAASERLKKYDDAEDYFKRVIDLSPQNADALNYLGYMLIDAGTRIQEGLDYVKRALEIDRNNGAYLDSLGWGYFKLNQLEMAEDNLRQALVTLSDNAVVNDHLGDLYFKLGKFQLAIQHWEKALQNKTNEIDTVFVGKKIADTKSRLP